MKRANTLFSVALLLGACGGGTRAGEPGTATTTGAAGESAEHVCPMAVPGTTARAIDVVDGVAIDYTTSGTDADVRELGQRLQHMERVGTLGMMAGPGGGRGRRGAARTATPAPRADVRLEPIAHGVRVILLPRDPAQLDELRARAHAHVERMSAGECARS